MSNQQNEAYEEQLNDIQEDTTSMEEKLEALEETTCGKPHNNARPDSECIECQVIKLNL